MSIIFIDEIFFPFKKQVFEGIYFIILNYKKACNINGFDFDNKGTISLN